jgi:hypothetical protein
MLKAPNQKLAVKDKKSSFALRIQFSAGRQFCDSKSAISPSAKTLAII